MQKLTLTRVFTTDKTKEGTPLISKKGIPYTKMSVKCVEYGDKWISGFKNKQNADWKEGMVVEAIITPNGEYINFSLLKAEDVAVANNSKLETAIGSLRARLNLIEQKLGIKSPEDYAKLNNTPSDYPTAEYPESEMANFSNQTRAEDIPF
jgi:hypothetical protein